MYIWHGTNITDKGLLVFFCSCGQLTAESILLMIWSFSEVALCKRNTVFWKPNCFTYTNLCYEKFLEKLTLDHQKSKKLFTSIGNNFISFLHFISFHFNKAWSSNLAIIISLASKETFSTKTQIIPRNFQYWVNSAR